LSSIGTLRASVADTGEHSSGAFNGVRKKLGELLGWFHLMELGCPGLSAGISMSSVVPRPAGW